VHPETIYRILHGEVTTPKDPTVETIAEYLGIPFRACRNWFHRDRQRAEAQRPQAQKVTVIDASQPTPTFFGLVQDSDFERAHNTTCKKCPVKVECWKSVNADGPCLCEGFIEKDLIPAHHLERIEAPNAHP
jgi:hypothetical protein